MKEDKIISVVIAAAGFGKRMGGGIPKQYLKIGGQSMLQKTTMAFCRNSAIDHICVVVNKGHEKFCRQELAKEKGFEKVELIIAGGGERQDSVYKGLLALENGPGFDYVLIHDAARPFVTDRLIDDVIDGAMEHGAALAAVQVKDTIRTEKITLERRELYSVQTPQAFERHIIMEAYKQAFEDGFYGTDDGSLTEKYGHVPKIIKGDYGNVKITTREDMPMDVRVGTGFDVHALVPGRKLILGGVEFPSEKGLLGHSDADVLTHAVMDALLGAAGMGDIGTLFPDTDKRYMGISSISLLEEVCKQLKAKGYQTANVDVTVICEQPRIGPRRGDMILNIAGALGIEGERVNIKGTTTEKLGFTGRGEGIAAEAVAGIISI